MRAGQFKRAGSKSVAGRAPIGPRARPLSKDPIGGHPERPAPGTHDNRRSPWLTPEGPQPLNPRVNAESPYRPVERCRPCGQGAFLYHALFVCVCVLLRAVVIVVVTFEVTFSELWFALNWIELNWIELNWIELNWDFRVQCLVSVWPCWSLVRNRLARYFSLIS